MRQVEVINLLVCSDIQCTDDDLFLSHRLSHIFIYFKLFFFRREIVIFQIQKLASEQSDACCIIFDHSSDIRCISDIGIQFYFLSVQRYGLFAAELLQKLLLCQILLFLCLIFFHGLFIRLDNQASVCSIHDGFFSFVFLIQCITDTDDCRDVHRLCKNCGMGVRRTALCHKRQYHVLIKLYSLAWCQIV